MLAFLMSKSPILSRFTWPILTDALAPPDPISTVLVRFILIPALIAMLLSTQVASEPVSTMMVEGTPSMEQATWRRWSEVKRMGTCANPLLFSVAANLLLVSLLAPRGA